MSLLVSVDPGLSGSLVVMLGHAYVDHIHMPTMKQGTKNRVNGAAVAAFLAKHSLSHAFIEQVGAMPGGKERRTMGAASAFGFGHGAGLIEGIIQGMGLAYTMVTPQAWKKVAGLIGEDKDASRSRAIQLYPGLRDLDLKGKGQALGDALLIGRYGATLMAKWAGAADSET